MGQSINAILFWGIAFEENDGSHSPPIDAVKGDEDAEWDEEDEDTDWEDIYAQRQGLAPPSVEYSDSTKSIYHQYWDAKSVVVGASGCTLDTYCSGDYPMWYAAIEESEVVAHRGSVETIQSLEVKADWEVKLRDFCDTLGLPWSEPTWCLVSYWG